MTFSSFAGGLGVLGFNAGFETGRATPEETAEEETGVDVFVATGCDEGGGMPAEAAEENQKGNLAPSTGSFFEGMLKGNMDAGINTVSSAASLMSEHYTEEMKNKFPGMASSCRKKR